MALLLFAFIYWQTAIHERERVDAIIIAETRLLAQTPAADLSTTLDAWLAADLRGVLYAGLFGADDSRIGGNLLALPSGLQPDGEPHRAVFGPLDHDRDNDGPKEVVRGVATRLKDGRLLILGYDLDELEDVDEIVWRALLLGLAPMAVLSLTGGMLLTLRAQRRIGAVHKAVDRIMRGRLGERLPVRGSGDELDKVSASVNRMLEMIEGLVEEIRGVGDSIAHDLRTPLARIRMKLERSRDESRTPAEFQAAADRAIVLLDHTLGVVGAILRIGEIEHGRRRAAFSEVDLSAILRDVAELYAPMSAEKSIQINVESSADARVDGDRDLLIEALGNLVDNAIKFAPPETDISLFLERRGPCALIRVTDHGPGIAEAERTRVLQRFYRLDKSRTVEGSGLGLSLVAAVIKLHGFTLRIGDADPGCVIEIICPFPTTMVES
jgi:signal transduction histidine kinase